MFIITFNFHFYIFHYVCVLLATHGLNVTYGIEMELLEGGLLKRSAFDVDLETDKDVSSLLSVSSYVAIQLPILFSLRAIFSLVIELFLSTFNVFLF